MQHALNVWTRRKKSLQHEYDYVDWNISIRNFRDCLILKVLPRVSRVWLIRILSKLFICTVNQNDVIIEKWKPVLYRLWLTHMQLWFIINLRPKNEQDRKTLSWYFCSSCHKNVFPYSLSFWQCCVNKPECALLIRIWQFRLVLVKTAMLSNADLIHNNLLQCGIISK